jgi:DNA-binding NarL/FixJ family response regulator
MEFGNFTTDFKGGISPWKSIKKQNALMKPIHSRLPDIVLVDDHLIFRQGIKSIVNFESIGIVIGEASNGNEFMNLILKHKPDLVLMDIDMPGMDGFEATKKALEVYPDLKIIAFSVFEEEDCLLRMIEYGAWGFILKTSGLSELETAIQTVMEGERYFPADLNERNNCQCDCSNLFETSINDEKTTQHKGMKFFTWHNKLKCM